MAAHSKRPSYRRNQYLIPRVLSLLVVSGLLGCGVLCTGMYGLVNVLTQPSWFILATVLATMTAVPYGVLLLWLDRNEKEPIILIITAFLWGACVSTLISGEVNSAVYGLVASVTGSGELGMLTSAVVSAPFIEELTKGFAVLLLFVLFHRELDNVLDGIIYGAIIGLGFAWFENITYYLAQAETGGLGAMLQNAWARGVISASGGSHAAYTALTGCGFGLVRVLRRGILRWLLVPLFWSLSIFAHFAWNTFVGPMVFLTGGAESDAMTLLVSLPMAVVVLQLPFTVMLMLVVGFAWQHENTLIRRHLADVPNDIVRPGELEFLVPARRRSWRSLIRLTTKGPRSWWRHRQLAAAQIELAFLRWHHERDGVAWEPDQDVDIQNRYAEIRSLRAVLAKMA